MQPLLVRVIHSSHSLLRADPFTVGIGDFSAAFASDSTNLCITATPAQTLRDLTAVQHVPSFDLTRLELSQKARVRARVSAKVSEASASPRMRDRSESSVSTFPVRASRSPTQPLAQ